jgi:hypothetical protein|tara:strand:- start:238 stop:972 length:735 start_codon:yes stop_codon:yes gene_type:complete
MALDNLKLPTETVELPSKGLLYSKDNPLSSGTIEMKYMTAKEEDILTNAAYIKNGTVIDKLLKSMIVSKINYDDLLIGDKNAILVAARILGYGKDYEFTIGDTTHTLDLTQIENKEMDESLFESGKNEFSYTLPHTDTNITFRLLTHGDEKKIQKEIAGIKKLNNSNPEGSTRLKYIITSVADSREPKDIREFVDNYLLAKDAREFRKHVLEVQPDVDLTFFPDDGGEAVAIPIGASFFYPDLD